jgi:hypothetical protein
MLSRYNGLRSVCLHYRIPRSHSKACDASEGCYSDAERVFQRTCLPPGKASASITGGRGPPGRQRRELQALSNSLQLA